MSASRPVRTALSVTVLALMVLGAALAVTLSAPELPWQEEPVPTADAVTIARGAELARAGNCMACHTARGGEPYAGGHAIHTPFGTLVAGNLTPDRETGLGRWSREAFGRALHEGISRDGRLLYPAFPYPHTTKLRDADVDALYAWVQSLPPVRRPNDAHRLRFPYNLQASVAVWRWWNFEPGRFQDEPERSASWNRGAYLVNGVGHCSACHSAPLAGGRVGQPLAGGLMPDGRWYAPSLLDPAEAGLQAWTAEHAVALLRQGTVANATVMGPMADVVFHGTSHLNDEDLSAVVTYLRELPVSPAPMPEFQWARQDVLRLGERVYEAHCAACHGPQGQGAESAYLPLAGNRAVRMSSAVNTVQAILSGGFAPTTAGQPQPFGMPPFRTLLSDEEVAAVASFIRQSWGNRASAVSALEVQRVR